MFGLKVFTKLLLQNCLKQCHTNNFKQIFYRHSSTMNALQLNPKSRQLEMVKKKIPETLADNKILIKVCFAGICGIDLHIIDGKFLAKGGPVIMGHEFCGIVNKIGKLIKHVKVGDRVVTDPNQGCMVCHNCRIGHTHFCKNEGLKAKLGVFNDGAWAEYCVARDDQVHMIPDCLSMEQAALTEPMSCISHTWDLISPVPIGHKILLLGCGIIGNLFASLLHLQGHRKVVISEPNNQRKKLTKGLDTGFEIINPDELKCRQEDNANYRFNLIVDCSGNSKAMEEAIELLDFGGTLCIFGCAFPTDKFSIKPFQIFRKEIKIQGALINPFSFVRSLAILETMNSRYIDYKKLGIKVFKLCEYEAAIENIRKGSISKAMFKFE